MTLVNLKDTYFQISFYQGAAGTSHCLIWKEYPDHIYVTCCGLSNATYIFTRMMVPTSMVL